MDKKRPEEAFYKEHLTMNIGISVFAALRPSLKHHLQPQHCLDDPHCNLFCLPKLADGFGARLATCLQLAPGQVGGCAAALGSGSVSKAAILRGMGLSAPGTAHPAALAPALGTYSSTGMWLHR